MEIGELGTRGQNIHTPPEFLSSFSSRIRVCEQALARAFRRARTHVRRPAAELPPVPARKPARRREAEQRRHLRERTIAVLQVALGELPPHGVDDARKTSGPRSRDGGESSAGRCPDAARRGRSCTDRCRAASRPARAPALDMSSAEPAKLASSSCCAYFAIAGSALGFGTSRSPRAHTMPLKSWPNSTLRPNTRSCTERSAGASCAKHTRRGRQSGPSSVRSIRNATPIASSVDCRTGPAVPDDQLLAQHDDVAGFLDRQQQRLVEPPPVARERLDGEPQRRLLANQQTERAEIGKPSRLGHQQAERFDAASLRRRLQQAAHRVDRDLDLGVLAGSAAAGRIRAACGRDPGRRRRATSA